MRDRQCLCQLRPSHTVLRLLRDDKIGIVVESPDVVAHKKRAALTKCAEVKFRGGALIQPAHVAYGNSRPCPVRRHEYDLCAHEYFAGVHLFVSTFAIAAMNVRLGLNE